MNAVKSASVTIKFPRSLLLSTVLSIYAMGFIYFKLLNNESVVVTPPFHWDLLVTNFSPQVIKSLLFNTLYLVPFGLFISFMKVYRILFALIGLGACILIEVLQPLLSRGVFDLITVASNLIGILLGFVLFLFYSLALKKGRGSNAI